MSRQDQSSCAIEMAEKVRPNPSQRGTDASQLPLYKPLNDSVLGLDSSSRWKKVPWMDVLLLVAVVVFSGAIGYFVPTFGLKRLDLNLSRAIVGIVGGAIGISCGIVLHRIARPHYDTAVWRVLIEAGADRNLSNPQYEPTPLSTLDSWMEDADYMAAFRIARYRKRSPASFSFASLWCLIFFVSALVFGSTIAFLYARTVVLKVHMVSQRSSASSINVLGSLTPEEQHKEYLNFKLYAPSDFPSAVMEALHPKTSQIVYFPEIFSSVLDLSSYGYGANKDLKPNSKQSLGHTDLAANLTKQEASDLLWPRWGTRVKCQVLDRPFFESYFALNNDKNSYLFIPSQLIGEIFLDLDAEDKFESISWPGYSPPYHPELFGASEKPIPEMNTSQIGYTTQQAPGGIPLGSYIYMDSSTWNLSEALVTLDVVVTQIETSEVPMWNTSAWTDQIKEMSWDAAVCVSLAEPFIFSSFQSSSGIKTAKLISPGSNLRRQPGGSAASQLPTGGLVLSDNADVMSYETRNKVNLPGAPTSEGISPLLILAPLSSSWGDKSFTTQDVSSFSMSNLEAMVSRLDAAFTLPYFVGTGQIPALKYKYKEEAVATVEIYLLIALLGSVLLVGLVGATLRPSLPQDLKYRHTSLAAFEPILRKRQEQDPEAGDDVVSAVAHSIAASRNASSRI